MFPKIYWWKNLVNYSYFGSRPRSEFLFMVSNTSTYENFWDTFWATIGCRYIWEDLNHLVGPWQMWTFRYDLVVNMLHIFFVVTSANLHTITFEYIRLATTTLFMVFSVTCVRVSFTLFLRRMLSWPTASSLATPHDTWRSTALITNTLTWVCSIMLWGVCLCYTLVYRLTKMNTKWICSRKSSSCIV